MQGSQELGLPWVKCDLVSGIGVVLKLKVWNMKYDSWNTKCDCHQKCEKFNETGKEKVDFHFW